MRAKRVSAKILPKIGVSTSKRASPFPEKRRGNLPFLEQLEFFQSQNLKILPKNGQNFPQKIFVPIFR